MSDRDLGRRARLPNGITLSCRAAGEPGRPVLMFLHGFPEAAFVWDELLEHFAGAGYRCVAPNLRGYEKSRAPAEVSAYRAKHLVPDIAALIDQLGGPDRRPGGARLGRRGGMEPRQPAAAPAAPAGHHQFAASGTFLRELQHKPAQQAASAYMNFLCRPDAEALLARTTTAACGRSSRAWARPRRGRPLADRGRAQQYREVWDAGLTGGCNYYRASPLRPPTARDSTVMTVRLAPEAVTVRLPTLVIWAEDDMALPTSLLDGLEAFVPQMRLVRLPNATHWVIHEQPATIAAEIERELAG